MKKVMFLAFVVLATAANAQSVSNKLSFKKGQKFEVYTQMNRTSQAEMMGQSMETSVASSVTSLLDVNDVVNDAATVANSVKRIKFDLSMFGREEKFDSDNKDDMNSDIGKMIAKALNARQILTIDGSGVITAVKEEQANGSKDNDQAGGMMSMFMGSMNNAGKPKVGDPSMFKILPNREVKAGEAWMDEVKDENGTRKTQYKIASITDSEILIDFDEDSQMEIKQEMMGQQAVVSVKAKSNGKIVLDKNTGLLKQKTFVTTSEEDINAAGMSMPSKSKMTTTITVKAI